MDNGKRMMIYFNTLFLKCAYICLFAGMLSVPLAAPAYAQSTVGQTPSGFTFEDPSESETDIINQSEPENTLLNSPRPAPISSSATNSGFINKIIDEYKRLSRLEKIIISSLIALGLGVAIYTVFGFFSGRYSSFAVNDHSIDPFEENPDDLDDRPYQGIKYKDSMTSIEDDEEDSLYEKDETHKPLNMDRLVSSIRETWPRNNKKAVEKPEDDDSTLAAAAAHARWLSDRLKVEKPQNDDLPLKAERNTRHERSDGGIDPIDLLNDLSAKDSKINIAANHLMDEEDDDPLNPPSSWYRSAESRQRNKNPNDLDKLDAFSLDDRAMGNHPSRPSTDQILKRIHAARASIKNREKAS